MKELNFFATLLPILIFFLVIFTLVKVYSRAVGELQTAERMTGEGAYEGAAVHFERSLRWYLPGLSLRNRAADGLWSIASRFETRGEEEKALALYRLLRSTFFSTRSFFIPGKDWIRRCNEKIATLMAHRPPPPGVVPESFERRKSEALAVLSVKRPPHALWAVAGEIGFFGWVVCALLFIFKGMTRSGRIRQRPALAWAGGWFLFYCLWFLGMARV